MADLVKPAVASAPADAIPRRLPEFFVVGHQKCGTTALYLMLGSHPQIFMPAVKEPRFFASDQRSQYARRPPRGRPRTLEDYLSLFAAARPEQRTGEASPQYLRSTVAASAIAAVQPDARVIAILREPASFLRSFHMQMVSSKVETQRSLRKALALEPRRRRGERIPRHCHHPEALMYSEHVRYVTQLQRFDAVLPRENMLVLIYDDFRRDNEATLRSVLRFLEVDEAVAIQTLDTAPLKTVRSAPLFNLTAAVRRARKNPAAAGALARAVNALTPGFMRSEAFRARWRQAVYSTTPPPDAALMRELRTRFKPEVVALSEYLDRDLLALWGYDEIA
jgi:Sulfotransferase domain